MSEQGLRLERLGSPQLPGSGNETFAPRLNRGGPPGQHLGTARIFLVVGAEEIAGHPGQIMGSVPQEEPAPRLIQALFGHAVGMVLLTRFGPGHNDGVLAAGAFSPPRHSTKQLGKAKPPQRVGSRGRR